MLLIYLQEAQTQEINPTLELILIIIFFVGMAVVILSRFYTFFEQQYAFRYKKPFFRNFILKRSKLSKGQLSILKKEFSFYNKLDKEDRNIFEHRLATFIKNKKFVGREELEPNDKMKTLISATAIMLTFGFRDYKIDLIETIIIYPSVYYSQLNDTYHKGETNPRMKTMVFSWEDFEHGYHIGDDNLNLGIHEFGHAIHLNAFRNNDISSLIFHRGFIELTNYLQNHKNIREDLIASKYFREYAYTNHYEFFAVLLENFIETPLVFKNEFPKLYNYMKQMLNFKFAGY